MTTNGSSTELIKLAASVPPEHRAMLLDAAIREASRESTLACNDCVLGEASPRIPWEGPSSPLFLLGSHPSMSDARSLRLYSSWDDPLTQALERASIFRSQVAIGTTLACSPGVSESIASRVDAYARCRRHVDAAINAAQSWLIVLMGDAAIRYAKGPDQSVSGNRGRLWWDAGYLYLATFSPSDARNSQHARNALTADLHTAQRIVKAESTAPPVTRWDESSAERLMPPHHRDKFRSAYTSKGWVVLHSKLISDKLAIVKDQSTSVPRPWDGLPRYTLADLNRLIPDPESFRRVHVVKKLMDCEVLT